LKSALQIVKTFSDEEEEESSQIAKESSIKANSPLLDMLAKNWCISTNESY
jgi:hypothetical protein